MIYRILLVCLALIGCSSWGFAQDQKSFEVKADSSRIEMAADSTVRSVMLAADSLPKPVKMKMEFKPDPKKAVLMALVPGLGQIYNRKFWKLPIVYGGLMGCMYAITWNEAGTMMVQVGLKPQRLLDELKQNEISTVVSDMPVYKGMEIYVADADTELVKGATDCDKIGKTFHDLGIPTDIKESDKPTVRQISVNDSGCRCVIRRGDKYIVAVTIDKSFYMTNSVVALLVVGIYLILASCCIMYMFSKIMKEKYEKEKLLYISNTDALTGCLNRHAYETDINKLDLKKEWIYISLDLNSLKHVNDTYGHAAGDEMICAAATCMMASFGEFGRVYRIGGDEFAVIITQKPDELDAMTKHFDSSVAEWRGKIVDSMTISYGCVRSLEEDWEFVHDIAKEADRRMYASKARYYSDSGIDRRK